MSSTNNFENEFEIYSKSQKENRNSVKFIHASDIHLGCQQYSNDHRSEDFIRAFQEILILAIKHRVNFMLLGGDVFTSLELLPEKLLKIVNILRDFEISTKGSIPIISIEGNHDIRKFAGGVRLPRRGQSWLKLIANLGLIILLDGDIDAPLEKMFPLYNYETKKGGKIQVKNTMIYGTRYLGQKPEEILPKIRGAITKDDGLFHILLQHYGIEGQMKNVPGVDLRKVQFLKDRVDYLALGHYHMQFALNDWIFNPRSSEAACLIDFSYKRGVFLVEVLNEEKFKKKVYAIRLNNRKYLWKTVHFPKQIRRKEKVYNYIVEKLAISCKLGYYFMNFLYKFWIFMEHS